MKAGTFLKPYCNDEGWRFGTHQYNWDIETIKKYPEFFEIECEEEIDLTKPLYLTEEPKIIEIYFYIHSNGSIDSMNFNGSSFDTYTFKALNCYPTKEHAQKAIEIIKAVKEFKQICRPLKRYSYYYLIFSLYSMNDKDFFCEAYPQFSQMADRLDLVLLQHLV